MDIYLDQNHWIALARAFHGRSDNSGHAELAAQLENAKERIRLPVSLVHLLELAKVSNEGRRHRLAEAFVHFGRGWVLAPLDAIIAQEVRSWVGGQEPRASSVVRRGLLSAFADYEVASNTLGVSAAEVMAEDLFGDSPGAWLFALRQPNFVKRSDGIQATARRYAETVESVRAQWATLPAEQRKAIFAAGVLEDVFGALRSYPEELYNAARRIAQSEPDDLLDLLPRFPTLDVLITMGEAKARDRSRPTEPNDLWDIAFLAVAIPYLDVVVTERFWAHLATVTGVSEKYSCPVLPRLDDLHPLVTTVED